MNQHGANTEHVFARPLRSAPQQLVRGTLKLASVAGKKAAEAIAEYMTVPRPQESLSYGPVDVIDEFSLPVRPAP